MINLLFALAIAFPREGKALPTVEQCYVIGSVREGVKQVFVQGQPVAVYHTGAWATRIKVNEGDNLLEVSDGKERVTRVVKVERRKPAPPPPPANKTANKTASAEKPKEKVYEKLPYAGDVPRAHPVGKSPAQITIVLDPGHGGPVDRGAISPHGWDEKRANLMLAKDVAVELRRMGFKVVMTREDDRAIKLDERPKKAHEIGADAFVSIHYNAPAVSASPDVRYSVVYSWNPLGERLAKTIAKRMNGRIEHANFAVTRSPEIPSCLIEADFITHPAGEEAAWNIAQRRKRAQAIAAGVHDWLIGG